MLFALASILLFVIGIMINRINPDQSKTLSTWVNNYLFYLVLPALALLHIPPLQFGNELIVAISAAWFTFGLSWLIFGVIGKKLGWDRNLTGCMIIVCGLANTSFMGFPVLELLYGKEALPTALLIDQAGSFLLVSSVAVLVASIYGENTGSLKKVPLKIITFPPFMALILAIALNLFEVSIHPSLLVPFSWIGQTMAPVALLAIGLKLSLDLPSLKSQYFWIGLGYRLILAPLIIFSVYPFLIDSENLIFKITVLESGMAPMITGSLIAIQYGLRPKLASQLSGIGMPIAIVTVLLWYWVLGA